MDGWMDGSEVGGALRERIESGILDLNSKVRAGRMFAAWLCGSVVLGLHCQICMQCFLCLHNVAPCSMASTNKSQTTVATGEPSANDNPQPTNQSTSCKREQDAMPSGSPSKKQREREVEYDEQGKPLPNWRSRTPFYECEDGRTYPFNFNNPRVYLHSCLGRVLPDTTSDEESEAEWVASGFSAE